MPSETDQASPQSVEERIGNQLWGDPQPETEEVESAPEETPDDQAEDETSEQGESATTQTSNAGEEVEIEVEGWKGKIPAKLKAEIDKGADYIRKTQALAEEKRLYDAQIRAFQEHQAFTQAVGPEMAEWQNVKSRLAQYESVNLLQMDADTRNAAMADIAQLERLDRKYEKAIGEKQGQFKQQITSSWDQMSNQAREVIVKSIPNWDSVAGQVAQWALNEGFPFEHITGHDRQTKERVGPGVIDPVFAKTLYKAMQWDKLQASKASAPNKVANAPPVVKPGVSDNRSNQQVGLMNFKKALKTAGSDSRKADLIGERLASKFFK